MSTAAVTPPIEQQQDLIETQEGRYLDMQILPDRIRFTPNAAGIDLIGETKEANESYRQRRAWHFITSDSELWSDLISDFIGNGWEYVAPEDVGDLRDSAWTVITRDWIYKYDDSQKGEEKIVGTAYGHADYAIRSEIAAIEQSGYVDYARHDYLTRQEFEYACARYRPDLYEYREDLRADLLAQADSYEAFRTAAANGQLTLETEDITA